jgi:antitoxin component YwqK of YwqJK toxin-antitoxin module
MLILLAGCLNFTQAQKNQNKKDDQIAKDTLLVQTNPNFKPTLEINPNAIELEKKKKKRKKKVFYGIKTKVRYTKEYSRNRKNIIFRKVHVLKNYIKPDMFVSEVYYYDGKKKDVGKIQPDRYDPEMGMLLHGAYERTIDGILADRGIFYKGTKHGRWEKYGNNMELLEKEYFYRGYPKSSGITFYDINQQKIKEVIPIHYGKKEGVYLSFYESGRIKEKGEYLDDIKVGRWYEYYDRDRSNNKKEIQYVNRNRPYEDDFEPYVLREWDEKGEKVVDNRSGRNK